MLPIHRPQRSEPFCRGKSADLYTAKANCGTCLCDRRLRQLCDSKNVVIELSDLKDGLDAETAGQVSTNHASRFCHSLDERSLLKPLLNIRNQRSKGLSAHAVPVVNARHQAARHAVPVDTMILEASKLGGEEVHQAEC